MAAQFLDAGTVVPLGSGVGSVHVPPNKSEVTIVAVQDFASLLYSLLTGMREIKDTAMKYR